MADLFEKPTEGQVTPSQAAESSAAQVIASRIEEQEKKYIDSIDGIKDPGRERSTLPSEETPKPAPAKTIPGAVADGGVTEDLLDRASQYDITPDEAKQMPAGALKRLLDRLDNQPAYEPEQQQVQTGYDANGNYWDGYQWHAAQPQFPELPKLDPAVYDEGLVKAWEQQQAFLQHQQQLIQQQNERLAQAEAAFQQQQQQAYAQKNQQDYRTLEGIFAKDEDMRDVIGEGSAERLVGTRHHAARAAIANEMDDIQNIRYSKGRPPLDLEALYERAKNNLYPERVTQKVQNEVTQRARNASGQFIARPTATTRSDDIESMPFGAERATRRLQQMFRTNGRN